MNFVAFRESTEMGLPDVGLINFTDKELVHYTIMKSSLTILEQELVQRLILRMENEDCFELPKWAKDLLRDDEDPPSFL